MDILAHSLWAAAVAKTAKNNKTRKFKNLKIGWTAFWGIFPDLFAFTPFFIWMGYEIINGNLKVFNLPDPTNIEPFNPDTIFIFRFINSLYNYSHSMIIFALVFIFLWILRKRPTWELFGWLFHILIDIPSHSYKFYPTPFLWPASDWKFDGISWGTPWFMIANYTTLIGIYLLFIINKLRRIKTRLRQKTALRSHS